MHKQQSKYTILTGLPEVLVTSHNTVTRNSAALNHLLTHIQLLTAMLHITFMLILMVKLCATKSARIEQMDEKSI